MLREYVQRHKDWSLSTFGEGRRTEGLCKHIEKELDEIRQSPNDLMEWVDVIILALDGAWRAGYSSLQIVNALIEKQAINFGRKWNRIGEGEPIEHVKKLEFTPDGVCSNCLNLRHDICLYDDCVCSINHHNDSKWWR